MQTVKYTYWQDRDSFVGYLLDYPDYWTQGECLADLKVHLLDLYRDLMRGEVLRTRERPIQ